MNHFYRENSPNPHIHWRAVPRYKHSVTIDDWTFENPDFGNPYNHDRWLRVPKKIQPQIAERLQQAISLGSVVQRY